MSNASKSTWTPGSPFVIPLVNLGHNYSPDPTEIRAFFDDGPELVLTLSSTDRSFGCWYDRDEPVFRSEFLWDILRTSIGVVPAVGPLEADEELLTEKYVTRQIDG